MDDMKKLAKQAISHFRHGISHDIFSEPVTTYAKLAIEALEKENGVTVPMCKPEDKKTNADRIRSMNDDELAICLYEIGYDEGWDKPEYALNWLRQPAEEDK